MDKKKLIITVAVAAIVGVAIIVAAWWFFVGKQTDDGSGGNGTQTVETDPHKEYQDALDAVNNDPNPDLSNRDKLDKTIEVMEASKKKFEEIGDTDKVNEINANLEMIRAATGQ